MIIYANNINAIPLEPRGEYSSNGEMWLDGQIRQVNHYI
jgi:hypothetical protein